VPKNARSEFRCPRRRHLRPPEWRIAGAHRFLAARRARNSRRTTTGRVKQGETRPGSRIFRDDGTQTCREESAVVTGAQKRKAIPVAYVSDSSSGTRTLNIEERLVTWRSYFLPFSHPSPTSRDGKSTAGRFISLGFLLTGLAKLLDAPSCMPHRCKGSSRSASRSEKCPKDAQKDRGENKNHRIRHFHSRIIPSDASRRRSFRRVPFPFGSFSGISHRTLEKTCFQQVLPSLPCCRACVPRVAKIYITREKIRRACLQMRAGRDGGGDEVGVKSGGRRRSSGYLGN